LCRRRFGFKKTSASPIALERNRFPEYSKYQMLIFKRAHVRWLILTVIFWFFLVFLPSVPAFRTILAIPLFVNDDSSQGDAAYVLSAGYAFNERLSAAVDLYKMGRVPKIIFSQDDSRGPYNFSTRSNWTPTEWALDFLKWHGIPKDDILIIPGDNHASFGTLNEARTVAKVLPGDVKRLVIITSAPHTRRSILAFKRSLSNRVIISSYAATLLRDSAELYCPIWLEYAKLIVYWLIA
jgi:uncharacterized SAM-binding protein YcdF (DUF218 family)